MKGYGNRDMQSAGKNALERVSTGKRLQRAERRRYVREMMATQRMRGALGRAPRRTGMPAHFVRWRVEAALEKARLAGRDEVSA